MKKLVIAALAIASMAACTKSNVQYEQPGEISLQPVAQKATKAAIATTAYPTTESFKIWAWWGAEAANAASFATYQPYIEQGEFVYRKDSSWGGKVPYYWPTEGSLFFAGYSPASANGQEFNYLPANKSFTVTGFIQSNNIAEQKDLLWFDITDVSYDKKKMPEAGVPVTFKHALSWLTFKFNLKDDKTSQNWTIKSVKLTGIEDKATFTAVKGAESATWKDWSVSETEKDKDVVNLYTGEYIVTFVANGTVLSDTDVESADKKIKSNAVLVIPQSCAPSNGTNPADAELVITYDLKSPTGQTLTDQKVSLPLNGTDISNNMWEPGKHYTYNITFGASEILIAPSVAPWTEVTPAIDIPLE